MRKLLLDKHRANRIEELWDWSCDGKECYHIKFKNVDGGIWVNSKTDIYILLNKTDDELQKIADSQ